MPTSPFVVVSTPDPHPARARRMIADHPELRALFGRNPWTAPLGAALAAVHLGLAVGLGLGGAPGWAALGLAWVVGAFLAHALFAVMHDAAHGLVFRARRANDALLLLANVPLAVPFGFPFAHWHLEHHRRQGDPRRDPDLPAPWELRVFSTGPVGKLVWHTLFLALQPFRTGAGGPCVSALGRGPSLLEPRVALHVAAQIGAMVALGLVAGPVAVLYLVASLYFVYSWHPLAGRFVQEHHLLPGMGSQETASYVGPLNLVSLNFGLHTEHHDFPAVPWNRLPAVRRIAPEGYAHRVDHRSWTAAWLRFLVDPRVSHASRVVRG